MSKVAIVTDSNSGITQAQAKELGIYIFSIVDRKLCDETIEIIRANKDCAFILFTDAATVSYKTIGMFDDIKNILMSIKGTKNELSAAADILRENHKFFAVYVPYDDENYRDIFTEETLNYFEDYTETFLFCMPIKKCSTETFDYMKTNAKIVRDEQKHAYVFMDVYNDTLVIDKMISGNGCSALIDINGYFYSNKVEFAKYNINDLSLLDIFKKMK